MFILLLAGIAWPARRGIPIEREVIRYIGSDAFRSFHVDRRCHKATTYRVYLIDNFEQDFHLVPEVLTSHGELLLKLLRTGREDIEVSILNTALSKGLAQIVKSLADGDCIDAVVSSIPGSNYTYDQVSSLLPDHHPLGPENILYHRRALRMLLQRIATEGFPSVEWLENIDVNPVKLKNDARKFLYIEALGQFNVPVILPYGNSDTNYGGKAKSVNLLSLASNAKVYSALGDDGERLKGFPYSPLSSGDERAVYPIVECPHPTDPFKAVLDINNDGHHDYTFFRVGRIAFRNDEGQLAFAPPLTRQDDFADRVAAIKTLADCHIDEEIVVTSAQYRELKSVCPKTFVDEATKPYIWLNAQGPGRISEFEPECWERGTISGTSLIPPNKLKELLPLREAPAPRETCGASYDDAEG